MFQKLNFNYRENSSSIIVYLDKRYPNQKLWGFLHSLNPLEYCLHHLGYNSTGIVLSRVIGAHGVCLPRSSLRTKTQLMQAKYNKTKFLKYIFSNHQSLNHTRKLYLSISKNSCIIAMEKCIYEWSYTIIIYCRRWRSRAINIVISESMRPNLHLHSIQQQ